MSRVFVLCPSCGADNHIRRAYCRRCFRAKDTPSGPRLVTATAAATAAAAAAAEAQQEGAGSSCRRRATATDLPTHPPDEGAAAPPRLPLGAEGPWGELPVPGCLQTLPAATASSVTDVTRPTTATTGAGAEQQCLPVVYRRPAQCAGAPCSPAAKATRASPPLRTASEPSAVTSVTVSLVPPPRAGRCEDDTTWATLPAHPPRPALGGPLHARWQRLPGFPQQRLLAHGRDAPGCPPLVTAGGDGGATPTCSSTSRERGGYDSGGTKRPPASHAAPPPEDMGDLIDRILSYS